MKSSKSHIILIDSASEKTIRNNIRFLQNKGNLRIIKSGNNNMYNPTYYISEKNKMKNRDLKSKIFISYNSGNLLYYIDIFIVLRKMGYNKVYLIDDLNVVSAYSLKRFTLFFTFLCYIYKFFYAWRYIG